METEVNQIENWQNKHIEYSGQSVQSIRSKVYNLIYD